MNMALGRSSVDQVLSDAWRASEDSALMLMSGGELFYDLKEPKRISHIRLNIGQGDMKSADLALFALPGLLRLWKARWSY